MYHNPLHNSDYFSSPMAVFAWIALLLAGCEKVPLPVKMMIPLRKTSIPEDYYTNAKVIALCKAILADDTEAIDRALQAGDCINSKGEGNMTPLMWCYSKMKSGKGPTIKTFIHLLKNGADPNVATTDGVKFDEGRCFEDSVTHLAARDLSIIFDAVMEHGGDPTLFKRGDTPLHLLVTSQLDIEEKKRRVRVMLEHGADLNIRLDEGDSTPLADAIVYEQFDIALYLLQLGADPMIRRNGRAQIGHMLVPSRRRGTWPTAQLPEHQIAAKAELIEWLNSHGQPIANAEEELKQLMALAGMDHLSATSYEAELKAKFAERDKIAREVWQKALAEDRAKEAAERDGEDAADDNQTKAKQ